MTKKKVPLLGEHEISSRSFPRIDTYLKKFSKKAFRSQVDRKRSDRVNRTLLSLIQKTQAPCFLLPEVLDFVERIDKAGILHHYAFTSFEIWLNQYSGLSFAENYKVRAKIAGKWVERSEYQALFPVGMGKVYEGTHFVTAHKSPDLDTTIASFWGWLDAFAARVGNGLHIWNLPGGPPPSQIEIDWIFRDVFGAAVFTHLPQMRTILHLSGNDLMTQKGMIRKKLTDSIVGIEHERDQNAVVIVDDAGFYLGDWRSLDVEGVRQVIILLSSCLRWFENNLHLHLISFFTKKELRLRDIDPILHNLFQLQIKECEPAQEFTPKQKKQVEDFIVLILGLKEGMESTFDSLGARLAKMGDVSFEGRSQIVQSMKKAKLFDAKGKLIEERPRIFLFLERAVRSLHEAIFKIRGRIEKFDIALKTKTEVFGHHPTYVTVRADLEEIRNKMAAHPYLTVTYPDRGKMYPVGVILGNEIRRPVLGTVSLRDFCNREEMGIPTYLEVISIIDHHKSSLVTSMPPIAIIADAQSSNTLVAQRAFQINDRNHKKRKRDPGYFIHPRREFLEYLHFLYGILDDTDLLTKVSSLDIETVVSLLNRMKSLILKKKVEIISIDDISREPGFLRKAAQKILQNEEMYSLYSKVYEFREKEVEKNIILCARGKRSNFFADTKEQNGCCRIGQTKMFAVNFPLYEKHHLALQRLWLEAAEELYSEKPEIDLHIHMISTIVSAEDVFQGNAGKYSHRDEMWLWAATEESALEHLKRFLAAFQSSPAMKNNAFEVEFLGDNANELSLAFQESFLEIPHERKLKKLPIAVLKFKAGTINSRKAMVSPYLPTLVS